MIKKQMVAALLSLAFLGACQSTPTPVSLNPQVSTQPSGDAVRLQVRDQRAHNYVMRLKTNDQTAEFATADPTLASLISERVGQRWSVRDDAPVELEIIIRDALFVVQQGSLRHDTQHNIRLYTKVTSADRETEKTFNGSRESNGPLRADQRRIEREFADLLGSVLNDVLNDETLTNRIREAQHAQ
ncbi:MAG: hypothetical protein C0463_04945 [Idiomarina sp.]|nr:hypothetical protein [Idiomarina sp.]MCL5050302.1 YajG family lipoprotein [Bacillota bacterium]